MLGMIDVGDDRYWDRFWNFNVLKTSWNVLLLSLICENSVKSQDGWKLLTPRQYERLLCVSIIAGGPPWKYPTLQESNMARKSPGEFDDFPTSIYRSCRFSPSPFPPNRVHPTSADLQILEETWPVPRDSRLACCCAAQRWPHQVSVVMAALTTHVFDGILEGFVDNLI